MRKQRGEEYTRGKAVPGNGSTRGCLCKDGKKYSVECCGDALISQGIGYIGGKVQD